MAIAVLVIGASGSGKSCSLRNLNPAHVEILNVAGKPLPFRGQLPTKDHVTYEDIHKAFKTDNKPIYVVDDSQYLMAFESFDKANEKGYDKFTHMAVHFKTMITDWIKELPDQTIVYFLHHTEIGDDQRIKPKTLGKMLDSQLVLEGLFSIVLLTWNEAGNHFFVTSSDGSNCAKTPMGMFPDETIDNDLALVDATIREYYGWPALDAAPVQEEKPRQTTKKPAKKAEKAAPAARVTVEPVQQPEPEPDAPEAAEMAQAPIMKPVDPAELEGLPENLKQLMLKDCIWPIQVQAFVADPDRGWYPIDTPLNAYDPDLLSEYLPSEWEAVKKYVDEHTFNEPF